MSRTVRRDALRSRSFQLANVANDPSFEAAQGDALINLHLPAVYDFLVAAGQANYYAADQTVNVTAGTLAYALSGDFLSLVNVFVHEGDDWRRPIDPIQDRRRQSYRAPQAACTVTVEYVPTCPELDEDADTFDGVDGWDELLTAKVARDILIQREGDLSAVMAIIQQAEARIQRFSTERDRGGVKMIADVESDVTWPSSVLLDGYRLRGDNIELYAALWGPYG